MLEQFNHPFFASIKEASDKAQAAFAKASADVAEFTRQEAAHAVSFAQSRKPEEAIESLAQAARARQEYFLKKSQEALEQLTELASSFSKDLEEKGAHAASQAASAVNGAVEATKAGLAQVEEAAKTAADKVKDAAKGARAK